MAEGGSIVVGVYGGRGSLCFCLSCWGGVYSVRKLVKLVFFAQCDVDGRVVYEYRHGGRL
ncbi:MAG: hypothetical protein QXK67_03745 [Pyrobaculum sp.]